MHKVDKTTLAQKILSWIGKRSSKPRQIDTAPESRTEQMRSGEYNEAFIFEHWASYRPMR